MIRWVRRRLRRPEVRAALGFVNQIRMERDLPILFELAPGYRGKTCTCPVARSLWACGFVTVSHDGAVVGFGTNVGYYYFSPTVKRFVRNFDEGLHPEYELA